MVGSADAAARRTQRAQRRGTQLEARRRQQAAQRRRQRFLWGGAALVAVLAIGGLVYWLTRPEPGGVQTLAVQGQEHIQRGQQHPPYNSTPPTSGWHWGDSVAPWGVSSQPIPDETQVHNLEHGGIMVQYDCPDGCPDVVTQLEQIVRSYPSKVILAPYPGIGHRIALTAWGRLAYLEAVDEPAVRRFVDRFKNQGPERVPD